MGSPEEPIKNRRQPVITRTKGKPEVVETLSEIRPNPKSNMSIESVVVVGREVLVGKLEEREGEKLVVEVVLGEVATTYDPSSA